MQDDHTHDAKVAETVLQLLLDAQPEGIDLRAHDFNKRVHDLTKSVLVFQNDEMFQDDSSRKRAAERLSKFRQD